MNRQLLPCLLMISLGAPLALAQPVLNTQSPFRPTTGTGIANLRVTQQSPDGTEVILTMDYSYDGIAGQSAAVVPLIEKRDQKGIAAWFGADPVAIGMGTGTISVKVRYFNDEPGVPAEFTSDRLRILVLNKSETAILSSIPFLKTIKWGSANKPQTPPTVARTIEAAPRPAVRPNPAAEAKARVEADQKATAEARALETTRLKADKESKKSMAEKARQEAQAKAREEARAKAEAETNRLAEERRLAEAKAQTEAKVRAEARQKADTEARARREAEAKAKTEAAAREEARLKAEAEAKRLAKGKQLVEARAKAEAQAQAKAQLLAEAKARDAASQKAAAEAKRLAEEKRVADQKARAEAATREEARLRAEAEEKARRDAEEKAKAEAAAREVARLKDEAEAKRVAEETRLAELKAKADSEASEAARLKAEAESKATPPIFEPAAVPATVAAPAVQFAALEPLAAGLKTKITNVDVVNRSLDRTRMTIGVEYDYKDSLGPKPMLGVDVTKMDEPTASRYFESQPAKIGKSRRNFILFPIRFQPPGTLTGLSGFTTDSVLVYLLEASSAKRFNLFPTTMLLLWRLPGAASSALVQTGAGSTLELDDFKQTDPHTGYVTVKYNLLGGPGKLRMRIFDASKAGSAEWFSTAIKNVPAGRGLQVLDISVNSDAKAPTQIFKADSIDIELVNSAGKVAASLSKRLSMTWSKPE